MEATAAGRCSGKEKEKEKESAVVVYHLSIPKWRAIYETQMVVNQPIFVEEGGKKEQIIAGCPIAEIFEVRLKAGKRKYAKIHGTVRVQCGGLGRMNLFQRSRLNPQTVHRTDPLELVGPRMAMAAFDHIFIDFHLMEGRNEVAGMFIGWDPNHDASDVVYSEGIYGRRSSVHISFVVYVEAVVATVEIKFKPSCPVEICGTINASNNMIRDWKSTLFSKKRSLREHLTVEHEERQLPLLRSIIAVPVNSVPIQQCEDQNERAIDGCLLIDFNLTNVRDEGMVAGGVFKFPIENFGNYVGTICSKYGEIQVKVYFDDIISHLPLEAVCPIPIDMLDHF